MCVCGGGGGLNERWGEVFPGNLIHMNYTYIVSIL